MSLDSRVRKAFYALPPATIVELWERMNSEAKARNLVYYHEGAPETIRIMLRPIGVMPDQLAYLNYVSLTILNALKRLPDLYLQDFAVRSIVPLSPVEEKWLWDGWGPAHRELNPVLGRLDAVVEFTSPMWKDSLRFMEPNLCGVGGIHLGPACEQLLAEIVLPVLQSPGSRNCRWKSARIFARSSSRKCSTICRPSAARARTSASSSRNMPTRGPTSRKCWPNTTASGTA